MVYLKPKQLIIKDCARRFVLKLYRHEASRGLFATAELLVLSHSVNKFTCGLTYDFDLIVNCDKFIRDQRRLIVHYLYLRVATEVLVLVLEPEYLYLCTCTCTWTRVLVLVYLYLYLNQSTCTCVLVLVYLYLYLNQSTCTCVVVLVLEPEYLYLCTCTCTWTRVLNTSLNFRLCPQFTCSLVYSVSLIKTCYKQCKHCTPLGT